jgi:hypothetical protein
VNFVQHPLGGAVLPQGIREQTDADSPIAIVKCAQPTLCDSA